MRKSRDGVGCAIASLAASVAAALVLVAQEPQIALDAGLILGVILSFYFTALVVGIPACLVIRLLPTRSLAIYVLWGAAVGAILAPSFQLVLESYSHGHQHPEISSLVWQAIRAALAGGIGLGVFWFIAVRSPGSTVERDAP